MYYTFLENFNIFKISSINSFEKSNFSFKGWKFPKKYTYLGTYLLFGKKCRTPIFYTNLTSIIL